MIPMTGDHFGPYEILGTLGRGGVGEVYRAWDARLEREVAVKLLHDDYPLPGNRERFLIEARAASALNHANICTIFDMGEKDGWPYLVMELLKGITVKQRIERSPMGAEEIVRVSAEIAAALGAAHALGIIHRDIKPANVMLTRQADGRTRVKVLDFGLAKLTEPLPGRLTHHDEHLTVIGEAVGTVSYMSPEQARGDELDGRSDLFSLGVVMYEMATRRTPFQGTTTALLFAQLLGSDPEPIREWNDSVPRPLEKIIFRLLEKEPGRRFQDAASVVEELEQVAARLTASRWKKTSSPAVPLVRVEEPVARPVLPSKPGFLREQLRSSGRPTVDSQVGLIPERDHGASSRSGSGVRGEYPRVADPELYLPRRPINLRQWQKRAWPVGGVAAAVICAAGAMFTVRAAANHAATLGPGDSLLITTVENHTGVQTLDGSIATGVEFDLAEANSLTVRTAGEFRTVVHALGADGQSPSRALARQAAEAVGAHAFVYGEVREGDPGAHSTGAGFLLHVAVLETGSGRELTSVDARAGRTEEVPGAIDEISNRLMRQLIGASAQSGVRQVPLAREATGSLNALHSYSVGVAARAAGRRTAALRAFAAATATDPGFVQAQIESAWLAQDAGAEVASAQAALRAMEAAQERSARTVLLAEVAGELIGRNDPERAAAAAKTLLDQNTHDVAARVATARALRAGGQYEKALRCAEQALAAGVREDEMYREAELSLIALDRYNDSAELEKRSARESVPHPEIALEAAYLGGKEDRLAQALTVVEKNADDQAFFAPARAGYLDNTGQLADGQTVWAEAARGVRGQPWMAGSGELLLARAALNRAFVGECTVALEFAHASARSSAGVEARSEGGLAAALCHETDMGAGASSDTLTRAALAMAAGEPQAAAATLSDAQNVEGTPVLNYLEGMAKLQSGKAAEAVREFQAVLAHRGSVFSMGSDLYPAAQLKLARAYAEAGEQGRSMEAYRQFLALWDGAGGGDRLRMEAVAGVRGSFSRPEEEPVQTEEVAVVRRAAPLTRESHSRRAREPFPTPAWLMPSAADKAPSQTSEEQISAGVVKSSKQAPASNLE